MDDTVFVFIFSSCIAAWPWEGLGQKKKVAYGFW